MRGKSIMFPLMVVNNSFKFSCIKIKYQRKGDYFLTVNRPFKVFTISVVVFDRKGLFIKLIIVKTVINFYLFSVEYFYLILVYCPCEKVKKKRHENRLFWCAWKSKNLLDWNVTHKRLHIWPIINFDSHLIIISLN